MFDCFKTHIYYFIMKVNLQILGQQENLLVALNFETVPPLGWVFSCAHGNNPKNLSHVFCPILIQHKTPISLLICLKFDTIKETYGYKLKWWLIFQLKGVGNFQVSCGYLDRLKL